MTDVLWTLFFAQVAMGAFDTIYHHEITERLAWRTTQKTELLLHGARNLIYALIFSILGWSEPKGTIALFIFALMVTELVLTLWDFVVEDRTRHLPASERITHTLLTFNYGLFIALLAPQLIDWAEEPTTIHFIYYGWFSWLSLASTLSVVIVGLRDLSAMWRMERLQERPAISLATALPKRQSILVTGGTGLIGSRLIAALVRAGHEVTVLTRDPTKAAKIAVPLRIITALQQIPDDAHLDAIVNLAGEPIANGLWTLRKRRKILRSRLSITRAIIQLIARLQHKPATLISGSAIGWYGLRQNEILDETSTGRPSFSRNLCQRWEKIACKANDYNVRVIILRTGLVLSTEGGFLSRLLMPFEFGLGGQMGHGQQWMSWIHRDDLVRLIIHGLATPSLSGPVNGTAPQPIRNADFAKALGRALQRPALLPMPAMPLRKVLGAFADELLLGGQRVLPLAAQASGFHFLYPQIDGAFAALFGEALPNQRWYMTATRLWS